jgi:hypothetical protein
MKNTPFKGEERPTDIVGPAVPTALAPSNRLETLASKWDTDAQRLAQYGAHLQADLLRQCSKELFEAMKADSEVLLTLALAAQMCGYSADHLGRLVAKRKLKNYGRKGSPKVRLGDLPRKPRNVVGAASGGYSANTDARSILDRGRRVA